MFFGVFFVFFFFLNEKHFILLLTNVPFVLCVNSSRGQDPCKDRDTPDSFVPSSSPESVVGMEISRYPDLSLVKAEPPSPCVSPVLPMLPPPAGKGKRTVKTNQCFCWHHLNLNCLEWRPNVNPCLLPFVSAATEFKLHDIKSEPPGMFFGSPFGPMSTDSKQGLVSVAITLRPAAAEVGCLFIFHKITVRPVKTSASVLILSLFSLFFVSTEHHRCCGSYLRPSLCKDPEQLWSQQHPRQRAPLCAWRSKVGPSRHGHPTFNAFQGSRRPQRASGSSRTHDEAWRRSSSDDAAAAAADPTQFSFPSWQSRSGNKITLHNSSVTSVMEFPKVI